MSRPRLLGAACATLLLLFAVAACNRADKTAQPTTESATQVPAAPAPTPAVNPAAGTPVAGTDRAFVADAAASGMAEVEASRFIAEKTGNAALKAYAEQMAREHTSANEELSRVAGNKGVATPTTFVDEPKSLLEKLKALAGDQADKAFLQDFGIDAHNKAIALFEKQAREGQDPDLRAYAERTLPKLREHLAMARDLQSRQ